ncbi:hypothetical protein JOM56_014696 [Amanita muscaria]
MARGPVFHHPTSKLETASLAMSGPSAAMFILEHSKTRTIENFPSFPTTRHGNGVGPKALNALCTSSNPLCRSGEYICEGSEGAILVLPEGAIREETINRGWFEELAKLRGLLEWYEYTKTLGRSISKDHYTSSRHSPSVPNGALQFLTGLATQGKV